MKQIINWQYWQRNLQWGIKCQWQARFSIPVPGGCHGSATCAMKVGSILLVIFQPIPKKQTPLQNFVMRVIREYKIVHAQKLTTLMPWWLALDAKTRSVETITDISGAPAATQNNFGFLMLCMAPISIFNIDLSKKIVMLVQHFHNCWYSLLWLE